MYSLLQEKGLAHFYDLRNKLSFAKPKAISQLNTNENISLAADKAKFYLKGIHCIGCLWLLEKLRGEMGKTGADETTASAD